MGSARRSTEFTVLIEGGIGPQPHPSFIEVFGDAAVDERDRKVEGAGKDRAPLSS
jgi:hypothetical protein